MMDLLPVETFSDSEENIPRRGQNDITVKHAILIFLIWRKDDRIYFSYVKEYVAKPEH